MLLTVTDMQFHEYCHRLQDTIRNATLQELKLLAPSLTHIQKQCTLGSRIWQMISTLQDVNHNIRRLERKQNAV